MSVILLFQTFLSCFRCSVLHLYSTFSASWASAVFYGGLTATILHLPAFRTSTIVTCRRRLLLCRRSCLPSPSGSAGHVLWRSGVRSRWCVFAVWIVPLLCSCQRQCGARQVPRFILIPLSPCGDAHSLCIKVTLSSARLERQCCAISICYTPCAVPISVVSFRFYTVNILENSYMILRGI